MLVLLSPAAADCRLLLPLLLLVLLTAGLLACPFKLSWPTQLRQFSSMRW
jgi:hypothetical protein